MAATEHSMTAMKYDCSFCSRPGVKDSRLLIKPADGEWCGSLFLSCFECAQCTENTAHWPAYALEPKYLAGLGSVGSPNITLRHKCQNLHPQIDWNKIPDTCLILKLGELMAADENIEREFPRVTFVTYQETGCIKDEQGREFADRSGPAWVQGHGTPRN